MKEIIKDFFHSSLMQRKLPFRVILPQNYRNSRKNYAVLYLLHGLFGCCDNWLELTDIHNYAIDKDFLIILPEGSDSWYSDSATTEKDKFESSFIEEFIPEIDKRFRTDGKGNSRAIAGLSMGGFGALKFAFKRPDLFMFAGSMSGAFDAPNQTDDNPGFDWENLKPSIIKAFDNKINQTRIDNDLFRIIQNKSATEISVLPYIYIDCGIEDGFLEVNRKLAKLLEEKSVAFEYHEIVGGHDWEYWNKQVRNILQLADKKFQPDK